MKSIPVALVLFLALALGSANAYPVGHHRHHHHHGGGGLSWQGHQWHVASGRNGAGQMNCPSHVSVSGGHLLIGVSGGCGGGIGGSLVGGVGSTWSVTFRDTRGGGKYAIGLWPTSGRRPEVDFAEDKPSDSARTLMTATYHPGPGCSGCIHSKISGNFTNWNTAAVTHTNTGYVLTLNGRVWTTYHSSYRGSQTLFIHNEAWGSGGSSTLEVSHVG